MRTKSINTKDPITIDGTLVSTSVSGIQIYLSKYLSLAFNCGASSSLDSTVNIIILDFSSHQIVQLYGDL